MFGIEISSSVIFDFYALVPIVTAPVYQKTEEKKPEISKVAATI